MENAGKARPRLHCDQDVAPRHVGAAAQSLAVRWIHLVELAGQRCGDARRVQSPIGVYLHRHIRVRRAATDEHRYGTGCSLGGLRCLVQLGGDFWRSHIFPDASNFRRACFDRQLRRVVVSARVVCCGRQFVYPRAARTCAKRASANDDVSWISSRRVRRQSHLSNVDGNGRHCDGGDDIGGRKCRRDGRDYRGRERAVSGSAAHVCAVGTAAP